MNALYTAGPIVSVNWEEVDFLHCTLDSPYKGGGLRFRLGTKDAKLNLDHDPKNHKTGPKHFPGAPIMYPDDAPAVAGDKARASWIMPASVSSMVIGRSGQPVPNAAVHSGFVAFGYFMAPLVEEAGIVGFTMGTERQRLAAFWGQFKFPEGDGKRIYMNRVAAPDVPDVTIRPLSKQMQPLKNPDGSEITIRVRDFWNFNDPTQYATDVTLPSLPASDEVAELLKGMTDKEREFLLNMVRKGASGGKTT